MQRGAARFKARGCAGLGCARAPRTNLRLRPREREGVAADRVPHGQGPPPLTASALGPTAARTTTVPTTMKKSGVRTMAGGLERWWSSAVMGMAAVGIRQRHRGAHTILPAVGIAAVSA
eukprot:scaffold6922_cov237-Isochrysis_galbana.AAC.2